MSKKLVGHSVKLIGNDIECMIPINALMGISMYDRVTQEEADAIIKKEEAIAKRIGDNIEKGFPTMRSAIEQFLPDDTSDMEKWRIYLIGSAVNTHDPVLADFELHHMLRVVSVSIESQMAGQIGETGKDNPQKMRVSLMYGLDPFKPPVKVNGEWSIVVNRSQLAEGWKDTVCSVTVKAVISILHQLEKWNERYKTNQKAVITEVYEKEEKASSNKDKKKNSSNKDEGKKYTAPSRELGIKSKKMK